MYLRNFLFRSRARFQPRRRSTVQLYKGGVRSRLQRILAFRPSQRMPQIARRLERFRPAVQRFVTYDPGRSAAFRCALLYEL